MLGIDSMTLAETAFMDQVDSDNKPIGVMPMIALVPTALSAPATQLYKSLEMRDNTANARTPVSNPHQGKYRVEVSRYLGNAAYAGSSTKAWYLMADAADLPLIEVAFLNGQESPTIETPRPTSTSSVSRCEASMTSVSRFKTSEPQSRLRAKRSPNYLASLQSAQSIFY